MPMRTEQTEQTVTAYLTGEIDHHAAGPIRQTLDELLQRTEPKQLILDFSGVTFMDSSGIGLVMGRYLLMQEFGGQIELQGLSAPLRRVMRLAGLDRIAHIQGGGK